MEQLESKLKQNGDANTERLIESIQRLESTAFELQIGQDKLKREVKELQEERQILVEEIETTKSNLHFVIEKNNESEQYNRGNNIRVFGVREVKGEEEAVETEKAVRELIHNKLGYKLVDSDIVCLFVCLFGFLTSCQLLGYIADGPQDKSVWQFYVLPHMRQSWETMTSVSAGHIIQTPTQPVGSGRPQRESNPGPPHQESRALLQSYRAPR